MIKLHLEVQLKRILYYDNPKKSHYTNYTLQNQGRNIFMAEGEELFFEQKFIPSKSELIQLDKLTPFQFYMIISNNKMTFCPFQLNFITKTEPTISRKMPIHQGHILKHYLNHQIFADIKPLEQIYNFEDGEIIYTVSVLSSQGISDNQEFTKLNVQFKKNTSLFSYGSERTQRDKSGLQMKNFQERETGITSNFVNKEDNTDYLNAPEIDLKSKKSMSMMSIQEIAEIIALHTLKEESQDESMIKSDNWCFKANTKAASNLSSESNLQSKSQNKLKIVLLLITIGLGLIMFSFFNNTSLGKRRKSSQKRRKQREFKNKKNTIKN